MRKINYVQILFLATRHVSNRPRNPKRDRSTSRRFASNLFRARNVHQSSAPLYFAIFKSARPAARHLLKLVSRRQYRKNKLLADYYFTLHPRLIKRRMEMTSLSLSLCLSLPRVGESVLRVFLPLERATSSGRAWTFSCLACARL